MERIRRRNQLVKECRRQGMMRRTMVHLIRHALIGIAALSAVALSGLAARAAGPQSVLPPGSAVKGWKPIGSPKLYNSNTLFNLIDGEAEAVMAYAFAGCAHGEYAPAG